MHESAARIWVFVLHLSGMLFALWHAQDEMAVATIGSYEITQLIENYAA